LLSIRFLLALIAFFAYAIQYTQKINMSVAIVCMINNTALESTSSASARQNNFLLNSTEAELETAEIVNSSRSAIVETEEKCAIVSGKKGKGLVRINRIKEL
jgi:hypothetical protein